MNGRYASFRPSAKALGSMLALRRGRHLGRQFGAAARLMGVCVSCALGMTQSLNAAVTLVKDQQAYEIALKNVRPGDEIVLADGTWQDFEILFEAAGDAANPITLRAQTPGGVIISGRSNLRLAGEHLVVQDLRFKNGFSPTRAVISFRRDIEALANHSRLTGVVIERFSKPDRTEEDVWIALYGKQNRVDHSYFAGKTNKGPTLIVRLDTPGSRENGHLVEHNFFGHRPSIGGNGGETLRIGVSDYSRTESETKVVRNFFEHCDGEVEIISIKAQGNLVAENVFYESRGAVVFRHGGNNEVSRNVFFGNGVSDTGGVRVINDSQTVKDNYFEGLRGEKFLSALTIMNGVPNSPINRYHQVTDAKVSNNSIIGFDAIGLAVGSDEERSAAPRDSAVTGNLFVSDASAPVSVFDDISGIAFTNNVSDNPAMASYGSAVRPEIKLARAANGLLYPTDKALQAIGAPRDLNPIVRKDTGPDWFEKPSQTPSEGREKRVGKGAAALKRAIAESRPGDILKLRGREYVLEQALVIPHALTIDGRTRRGKRTTLHTSAASLFEIPAGGALTLSDVELQATPTNKAIIRAVGDDYQGTYSLALQNVAASAQPKAQSTSLIAADDATFATLIELRDVTVDHWPGPVMDLSGAKLEGWYLAEDIEIENARFTNIAGPLLSFGREGRDESTFGPRVRVQGSTLKNVNPDGVAVDLRGIDGVRIQQNTVRNSGAWAVKKRVLGLTFEIGDNHFEETQAVKLLGVEGEALALPGAEG